MKGLGAVSWWKFDGNAQDSIGNNDGILHGGVNFVNGKYGEATSFNGVDSSVDVGGVDGNYTELTMCLWFNSKPSYENYSGMLVGRIGGIVTSIQFRDLAQNQIAFYYTGGTSEGNINIKSRVDYNIWNHVCALYNGTSVWGSYNGDVTPSNSISYNFLSLKNTFIGKDNTGRRNFNGSIDNVMIFNKALTKNQVKALYKLDLS